MRVDSNSPRQPLPAAKPKSNDRPVKAEQAPKPEQTKPPEQTAKQAKVDLRA